jgi:hypothetical protein
MKSKSGPQVTMDILKETARQVDFMQMIREQYEFISQANNIAGSNPSKTEKAYIEEQDAKLKELENIVKRWVREAFNDDKEIYEKTDYFVKIEKNFTIRVLVEKNN